MSFWDIFKSSDGRPEVTRVISIFISVVYPGAIIGTAKGPIDPVAFATGIVLVCGGIGAMIGGKAIAVAKANATTQAAGGGQ